MDERGLERSDGERRAGDCTHIEKESEGINT